MLPGGLFVCPRRVKRVQCETYVAHHAYVLSGELIERFGEGFIFCDGCGTALRPEQSFCSGCGKHSFWDCARQIQLVGAVAGGVGTTVRRSGSS